MASDKQRITELQARVKRLEDAIRWALGEVGDFPGGPEPPPIAGFRQRYFWRSELRARAGIRWTAFRVTGKQS